MHTQDDENAWKAFESRMKLCEECYNGDCQDHDPADMLCECDCAEIHKQAMQDGRAEPVV